MENKYTFNFSPSALEDFNNSLNYIEFELCNKKASEDLANKIFNAIDNVREFPNSGLQVDNEFILDQSLRRILVGNYKIFYRIEEDIKSIIIVRIIHSLMDNENIDMN